MSKIKNSGLDQYGAERFEQQQLGTAGTEEVKTSIQAVNKPGKLPNFIVFVYRI